MKRFKMLGLVSALMLSACSGIPAAYISENTQSSYLKNIGEFTVDTYYDPATFKISQSDETNEAVLSESEMVVYAEVMDVSYFTGDNPYSIVRLNVLDSLTPHAAGKTIYLYSEQALYPGNDNTSQTGKISAVLSGDGLPEEPIKNSSEEDWYVRLSPDDKFYQIGEKYILFLKQKEDESFEAKEPCYVTAAGNLGKFLEADNDVFIQTKYARTSHHSFPPKISMIFGSPPQMKLG